MNLQVQVPGAATRPTFFRFFRASAAPAPAASERRSATLSDRELRQIVAAMVD